MEVSLDIILPEKNDDPDLLQPNFNDFVKLEKIISTAKEHKEEFQIRTFKVTHNKFEVYLKGEDFKLLLTNCLELDL